MHTEDSLAEEEMKNKPVSMYKQPDYRKLLRNDGVKQALTQRGRCSEHIHSGKTVASADVDPVFVKQNPPQVCRQMNSS